MADVAHNPGKQNPGYILTKHPTKPEAKAERKTLRAGGTRGPDLKKAMKTWRQQQADAGDAAVQGQVDPDFAPYVKHPAKFLNSILQGKGPAFRRLERLRQASEILGYDKNKQGLEGMYAPSVSAAASEDPSQAGSKVEIERDFQESPTFQNWSDYIGQHIDPKTGEATGLTANEENAIRQRGLHAISGAAGTSMDNEMTRLAAAGIDPRSGLGATQAMKIQAGVGNDRANLEQSIADENLARKQQFEGYAADQGRAEEQRRQFDVSGDLRRLSDVEQGQAGLSGLDENQRQFDVGYTESQRQAKLARQAMERAAKELEPSVLDKVSSGLSGFVGGLSGMGGGGGGKGGGIGGMFGGF